MDLKYQIFNVVFASSFFLPIEFMPMKFARRS